MKKYIKMLSVAMATVFLLASCGTKTEPAKTETDGTKTETTKEADKGEAKTATDGKTANLIYWTIADEPKDLKMVNDKINEYTLDKINTTVEMKYIGWGDYSEKMAKIIQSGEYYDIAFGASINNSEVFANKGYFLDLKDMVQTETPALYSSMPEELWQAMETKGVLYGVPTYKDSSAAQYFTWSKEVVDKLGIDINSVTDFPKLTPELAKIKEAYPSEFPLHLKKDEGVNGIQSYFDEILKLPRLGVRFDDPTAQVKLIFDDEESMQDLRLVHEWMKAGYINPDAGTVTEVLPGIVGSAQGFPGADVAWSTLNKFPVVSNLRYGPVYSTGSIRGSFQVISASSEYPVQSLKLLELINTDVYLRNLYAFGIEDVHYKKTGDTTLEKLNDEYITPAYSQGTFFLLYTQDPAPANQWQLVKEQNEKATASPILGFTFDVEPVKNQIAATSSIYDKYKAGLLTGTTDPDVEVPKMIEELNKAGLQDIITEAQKQVDEFMKTK